jgi:hypothetical protein
MDSEIKERDPKFENLEAQGICTGDSLVPLRIKSLVLNFQREQL